jgi:hypothetical protein
MAGVGDVMLFKAADNVHAAGMDGVVRPFEQPHLQTAVIICAQVWIMIELLISLLWFMLNS